MNRLREKERFRECLGRLIEQFSNKTPCRPFVGAEPGPPLEHTTRRHFIDPFLQALGWDLTKVNEDIIEEARTRGETTLRLDYLGINPQTRIPVLIIEAKAWTAPFVARSTKKGIDEGQEASRPISLICAAVEHHKARGNLKDSPVTLEWAGYIAKLHQYVTSIKYESGHIVTRVAILSGQWLVTFSNPESIFLAPTKVDPYHIGIYRGRELITHAEAIFNQLARCSIIDAFPETIRPSLLPAFIDIVDIKRAYRALWVSRKNTGASWKPRPNIHFEIAMVIERKDGALLNVIDQSLQGSSIPHDYREIRRHINDITIQSDRLLRQVNLELGATLQPSDVESFPGFHARDFPWDQNLTSSVNQLRTDLLKMVAESGEFLLVTGTAKHFLFESPIVNHCGCHDWGFCQAQAQEQGKGSIIVRSVKPKAFFISGEEHHCAHRVVHDRRYNRCQVGVFEEFLCCRACVFQSFCWQPQELADLPCGISR